MTGAIRGRAKGTLLIMFALVLTLPTAPALSAPFAGTVETADAVWRVKSGRGSVHQLTLSVEHTVNAIGIVEAGTLRLQISRCKRGACGESATFLKAIEPSDLSVADDLSTASLRTTFAGAPLEVDWSGGSSGSFAVLAGVPETSVTEDTTTSATVAAFGVSCNGSIGTLTRGRVIHTDRQAWTGAEEPQRVPQLKKRLRCIGPY